MSIRKGLLLLLVVLAIAMPAGLAHAVCTPNASFVLCGDVASDPQETHACAQLIGHYEGVTCAVLVDTAGGRAAAICSDYDVAQGPVGACLILITAESAAAGYVVVRIPLLGCQSGFVLLDPANGSDYGIGACS